MSVVGIDLGAETCIVAAVKRGGLQVLQNESGRRKTATMVAYNGQERFIGDAAISQFSSNFKNTIILMKRFLGKRFSDPEIQEDIALCPYKVVEMPSGTCGFEVQYDSKKTVVSVENVTAAMLIKLKQSSEAALEKPVVDVVMTCPPYFTDVQRWALMNSAKLAGLNVLRLLNETTAVAINYGILRPMTEPRKVMFVDIGHTSTNASVVQFDVDPSRLTVMATASNPHVGARNFDRILVDHFSEHIKQKYKMDVLSELKPTMKLFRECERVKKVLSANTSAPLHVEYIMNDTDVHGAIERTEFEALAQQHVLPSLLEPIRAVMERSGVTAADLFAVEIVGGGSRIPCIEQAMSDFIGMPLSRTCDGDESVGRGAALQCAMLHPSMRVKDFQVCDLTPYPIEVAWSNAADYGGAPTRTAKGEFQNVSAENEQSEFLFTANSSVPSVKMMTFSDQVGDLVLVGRYADPQSIPVTTDPVIGAYVMKVPHVSEADRMSVPEEERKPTKLKVKVKINKNGMFDVTSATLSYDVMREETVKEEVPVEDGGGEEAQDNDGDVVMDANCDAPASAPADAPADADASAAADAPAAAAADAGTEDAAPADTAADATDKPADAAAVPSPAPAPVKPKFKVITKTVLKKRTVRKEVVITALRAGELSVADFEAALHLEGQMAAQDRLIAETNDRRNELESYILNTRTAMQNEKGLGMYISGADRSAYIESLDSMENWLFDEGFDANKSTYVEKLKELKVVGDAAYNREWEAQHRTEAVAKLQAAISHWQSLAASEDEKYSHIEADDRNKVAAACTETQAWLDQQVSAIMAQQPWEEPAVTCKQLAQKKSDLDKANKPIMNKSKPKPKEPEPKAPNGDAADAADVEMGNAEAAAAEAGSEDAAASKAAADANGGGDVDMADAGDDLD